MFILFYKASESYFSGTGILSITYYLALHIGNIRLIEQGIPIIVVLIWHRWEQMCDLKSKERRIHRTMHMERVFRTYLAQAIYCVVRNGNIFSLLNKHAYIMC